MSEYDPLSSLEMARERSRKRVNPAVARPAVVGSLSDIQRVIAQFAPGAQRDSTTVQVNTILTGEDEQGQQANFKVSAPSTTKSKRTIIIEGLEVVKRYMEVISQSKNNSIPIEVNGQMMSAPQLTVENPTVFIDPLVKQWFGGVRDGLRICWDLSDGYRYYYDIYEHKITRKARDRDVKSDRTTTDSQLVRSRKV